MNLATETDKKKNNSYVSGGRRFPFDLNYVYINILVILPSKIQAAANQTWMCILLCNSNVAPY